MFGGADDDESVISLDIYEQPAPAARPTPDWAKKYVQQGPTLGSAPPVPFNRDARVVSVMEDEFGWSGSAGGIRGRDDRQIERDAVFEAQMEERRRKRKERKKVRESSNNPTVAADTAASSPADSPATTIGRSGYRPVFAPNDKDLAAATSSLPNVASTSAPRQGVTLVDERPVPTRAKSQSSAVPSGEAGAAAGGLRRGMSLKDKVGAALGRFGSRKAPSRPRAATTGGTTPIPESGNSSAAGSGAEDGEKGSGNNSGKEEGLLRKLSRKMSQGPPERRRRELVYVEPPKLSHVLVGGNSPFPMRPPLAAVGGDQPPRFQSQSGGSYRRTPYGPNGTDAPGVNEGALLERGPPAMSDVKEEVAV